MFIITDKVKGTYKNDSFDTTSVPAGFQMEFANGNTISVQFGFGNYCDNRNESKQSCKDAEIAIWNKAGDWYTMDGDQVKGYCTPDEVAKWMMFAANTNF